MEKNEESKQEGQGEAKDRGEVCKHLFQVVEVIKGVKWQICQNRSCGRKIPV